MTDAPNPERYHKPWALDARGNHREVDGYRIFFPEGQPPLLAQVEAELHANHVYFTLNGQERFDGVVTVCCGAVSVDVELLFEHPDSIAEGVGIHGHEYDFKFKTYLLDSHEMCSIGRYQCEGKEYCLVELGIVLSEPLSTALVKIGNGGRHIPSEDDFYTGICASKPEHCVVSSTAIETSVAIRIGSFYRSCVGTPRRGDELEFLSTVEEKNRLSRLRCLVYEGMLTQCKPGQRVIEDEFMMTPENAAKWDALVSQIPKRRSA